MITITNRVLDELFTKGRAASSSKTEKTNAPKEITVEQANAIFETRKPLGKFYFRQNRKFIGIDNSAGDAECCVFDSFFECGEWLGDQL